MSITNAKCHAAVPGLKPKKLSAGDGLYLLISTAGTKTWKWSYRLHDPVAGKVRQYDATLGSFPEVDAKKVLIARAKAAEYVSRGEHPPKLTKTQQAKATAPAGGLPQHLTVWGAVEAWLKLRMPHWSPSYAAQVRDRLTAHAGPETVIGKRPYAAVRRPELFVLIESIGAETPAIAKMVKQWLTAVFERLVDAGQLEANPLAGMKTKSAVPNAKVKNSTVLQPVPFAKLMVDIRGYGERRMAIYLELLARTCVRLSELRCADWAEFDFDAGLWTIPASRMKMKTLHVVPLSPQCIALLRELQEYEGGTGLLFPNANSAKEPMAIASPREAVYRISKKAFHPHGFRSTFSTIAHEEGKMPHLIEAALAHQQRNKTAAAYNKATYIEERRGLMAWWSDYLDELIANELVGMAA
ncbi:tyrosine-type recombinase/integrase [Caballeronia grimmiae]|uniref:tyrosine-type recombinase/integrase n=1 Tax=Caballeronia grimmiae TaxID=1071679 RepID=UPI0038BBFA96